MRWLTCLLIACHVTMSTAQPREGGPAFEPTRDHPWGSPNPAAPSQIREFAFMIGNNDCEEQRRNAAGGDWTEGRRTWDARYTMNGFAIADSGRSGGAANANIRAFDMNTGEWVVTFFSMPAYASGIWRGGKSGDTIVLRQAQRAPGSNLEGMSTLTFSNISPEGFDWEGKWISDDGAIEYPFWRIQCRKIAGP